MEWLIVVLMFIGGAAIGSASVLLFLNLIERRRQ